MSAVQLLMAVAGHLEAVELRVRRGTLRDYDISAIRLQIDAAQTKLAGALEALSRQ
jgi:hypothetical protein